MTKYEELVKYIKTLGSVAVAYSGGVDSALLLYAANEALGHKAMAITVNADTFPERECADTVNFSRKLGVRHEIVDFDVFSIEGFSKNTKNRCYICKKKLLGSVIEEAKSYGIDKVVEGSNLDDEGDYRPGLIAVKELGVLSPLRELRFTKADIRSCARSLGITVWNKPSMACLASRIPYEEEISREKLHMVGKGEEILGKLGFVQYRVRLHGNIARIEVEPSEFDRILDPMLREKIYEEFSKIGFLYIALDLKGYRTGSLNEHVV